MSRLAGRSCRRGGGLSAEPIPPMLARPGRETERIRMMNEAIDEAGAKRRRFRALLERDTLTVMPGGFSPLYARLAQEAGFEAFFLAGSQLSMVLYGLPDNGIVGLRDVVDHARHMA